MSRVRRITTATVVAMALSVLSLQVSAQNAETTTQIDLPAQPLAQAIQAIARQASINILVDPRLVEGREAPAVKAELSIRQALNLLLQGTGLTPRYVDDKTITLVTASPPIAKKSSNSSQSEATNLRLAQNEAAQTTDSSDAGKSESSSDDSGTKLQEIIVTAQKREERLQDVPISMSVLSGNSLDKSTAQGVFDELNRVPGVVIVPASEGGATQIAVRGVSSGGVFVNGASPIGYYLDSVPFGFVRSALIPDVNSFDLERIEVLRGPQGTLYGASAEDGVVRVISNDADLKNFDLKARVLGSGTWSGGFNHAEDVAVNVPIVDGKLAVRGVVDYQGLSGWIDRPEDKDANYAILRNYRLKINGQPTDNLSIGLSLWSSRDHLGAMSTSLSDGTAPLSGTTSELVDNNFDAYGLKISYQFPSFSISSMTSYLDFSNSSAQNLSPYGGPIYQGLNLNAILDLGSKVFSEELLLNSTDNSRVWRWTAGGFYRDDTDHFGEAINPINVIFNFKDTSRSYAFFGEIGRQFFDRKLELTVGLRQFHDVVSTSKLDPTPPAYSIAQSFNATTPKAVLSWYPVSSFTAYASFSEGFRSGMPQYYTISEVLPDLGAVKPDKLYNYEVGAKSDFLEHRLSLDAAVYYVKWRDVQQSIYVPFSGGVILAQVNGPDASGAGVDLSVTTRPVTGLELGGTFSWNDLAFDDIVYSLGQVLFNKGDRLNNSSKYTGSLFGTETFPLGGGFSGQVSASANYTSRQSTRTFGIPYPAYGDNLIFLNASLSLFFPSHWSLEIFGDNLTNEYRAVVAPPQGYAPSAAEFTPRPRPRTLGLQVDYRFK